jgi:hypothetical protein
MKEQVNEFCEALSSDEVAKRVTQEVKAGGDSR